MLTSTPAIYLVDDNAAVCESLTFLYASYYDLPVITYNNPLSFLEDYSLDWRGCLLIDLFMPIMNGIELLTELTLRNNTLPVIIISGHGGKEAVTQSLQAGATEFITKPFKVETLLALVNHIKR